jgi:anthranilate/para-aminobenzoate synthase component I
MLLEATTVTTIIREVSADLETPVSLYLKLRGDGASFLLESVEGGERIARYSLKLKKTARHEPFNLKMLTRRYFCKTR